MSRDWDVSLFSCFDNFDACVVSCFCPCYQYGLNKAALMNNDEWCGPCFMWFLFACVGCSSCFSASTRADVRSQSSISGGCLGDCLTHFCCSCCALVQEASQIQITKSRQGAYLAQGQMVIPGTGPQGLPGYPPQGNPQQGYPPQGNPQQGYPPQGNPQQGYAHPPQQGYAHPPQQGYAHPPQQGYAHPPQGYHQP